MISACLLGDKVRYNGDGFELTDPILIEWLNHDLLIKICPEVDAGLSTSRTPAEIQDGSGEDVLNGTSRIKTTENKDVTAEFIDGAQKALKTAQKEKIKLAILKENSPSCGSSMIYDGSFSGQKKAGKGVTGALLSKNGVLVFSEEEIQKAYEFWKQLQL